MDEFIIRDAAEMSHFTAGDLCSLAEVLHPDRLRLPYGSFSLSHATVAPGGKTLPHKLTKSTEIYYILSGVGKIYIDGSAAELKKDRALVVPPGCVQYVENGGTEPLAFLCLATPPWRADGEALC